MSNGHKLELETGKSEVFLNYWDWIAGEDVLFVLRYGKAFKEVDGKEVEINLASELLALSPKLDRDVKRFNKRRK